MNDAWIEEQGLRWRRCTPFGVEIVGDLAAPMPPHTAERFVALLRDHGLIVARGQSLDRPAHDRLLGLIGPVIARREGDPGFISSGKGDEPGAGGLSFHADTAYTETPFQALSLHAVDVVDGASSTRFVHAEEALVTLAPALRTALEQHDAEMISAGLAKLDKRLCDIREHPDAGYRNRLPAVRYNPLTGRSCIGVSEMHTAALLDMAWEDSRETLGAVFAHLYAPERVHEHVWRNGDLVVWDNIALQHGRGSLRDAGRRILQRVIVGAQSWPVRLQPASGAIARADA